MIEIESSVPLPALQSKYPFDKMEVGDSFFIPCGFLEVQKCLTKARNESQKFKQGKEVRFYSAIVDQGVRVWRIL
jgi:hypothetical protein